MSTTARALAFASLWFDAATVDRVFEPMLADRARDLEGRASLLHRARWWGALGLTVLHAIPAAAFRRVPLSAYADLGGRATAFGVLGFQLQWLLGARLGPQSGAIAWPPSLATTAPLLLVPVVMRLRRQSLPEHQRRLLATIVTVALIIAACASNAAGWQMDAAMALGLAYLGYVGWRLGVYEHWTSNTLPYGVMIGLYAATSVILATIPIKLVLGIGWLDPWWPGDNLVAWLCGAMVGLSSESGQRTSPLASDPQNRRIT